MMRRLRLLADRTTLEGAGITLLAAALLGAVHNAASPLGVRFSDTALQPPAEAPASPYSNSTLSVEVVPPARGAAPATQSSAPGWKLESVRLAWNATAAPSAGAASNVGDRASTSAQQPARRRAPSVTWAQAEQLVREQRAVLVDARTEDAFRAGRIPGAINLPFIHLAAQIAPFKTNYPPSRLLVLYCADLQCPVSHSLADALLNQHGYEDVRVLAGGYLEWRKASAQPGSTR